MQKDWPKDKSLNGMPAQATPMDPTSDKMNVGGQVMTETAQTGIVIGTGTESGIIAVTARTDMGTANAIAVTAQKTQVATEGVVETGMGTPAEIGKGPQATGPLLRLSWTSQRRVECTGAQCPTSWTLAAL